MSKRPHIAIRWRTAAQAVLAATILLAAVPSTAGAGNRASGALHRAGAHVAIVGGLPAEPGMFPWMAYVFDARGKEAGQCSGTVVAPDLVLTAGHCAENVKTGVVNEASGYRVVTGNVDWTAPERQVSSVSRVIVCPCFDRSTHVGDAALLVLSTPTSAPAVTLAAGTGPEHAGETSAIAGWGVQHTSSEAAPDGLRWAQTTVQATQWCERQAAPFSSTSEICAIDTPDLQTGVCYGDSGGPLLAPGGAGENAVEIGIASHIFGHSETECDTTLPDVFTRVAAISSWITGWIEALRSPTPAIVAPPLLPGIVTVGTSGIDRGGVLSLSLECGGEGGVCSGALQATVTLREERLTRRDGRPAVSRNTRRVQLAVVNFTIAPGYRTTVRVLLSPQNQALLARLRGGPLDVLLAGQDVTPRVATL